MSLVVATAAVAPVLRDPDIRAEQVTQLLLGRTAEVREIAGAWRRLDLSADGYAGWVHHGYLREITGDAAQRWMAAEGWSEGAVVLTGTGRVRVPLGARVLLHRGDVELPDGRRGRVVAGRIAPAAILADEARAMSVDLWMRRYFEGAPYLWGGLTPAGVDCSGLVQMAFAARGTLIPRDSTAQATAGKEVRPPDARPGDLLFFAETPPRIGHVAVLAPGDLLVHSALGAGGFVVEPWGPGTRAAFLRQRLVAVRRIPGASGPAR